MKFKKGSKVEVLSKKEVPSGEWRCAEVISGNGHTYSVQYDCSSITSEAIVERVPRKAIRPYPPAAGVESWTAGDIVEVYDAGSWKVAIVLKFSGGGCYLVRLLGSCNQFTVHKSSMRIRLSWQDNQWVVMRKVVSNSGVGMSTRKLCLNDFKVSPEVQLADTPIKHQARNDWLPGSDGYNLLELPPVSSTTLKRVSPYCSSPIESYPRKKRAIDNRGDCQRFVPLSSPPMLDKVDAVAYPHENMGEKCMHASFNNVKTQYNEIGKGNPNNAISHFLERCEEATDSGTDLCSVGSCSVMGNGLNEFSSDMLEAPCQDADSLSSDADSLDVGVEEERFPSSLKEDEAAKIHRLELHAYCSTLQALFASGPLSWEQEALLTNLRIALHISNDEHLMEIRNLISPSQHI